MIDIGVVVQDRAETELQTEDKLARVVQLANLLSTQQRDVERLQDELKLANEKVRRTECEDFPLLMKELGLHSMGLEDGSLVELIEKTKCGITEANRSRAMQWLTEKGFSGLIKTELVVSFDRGAHDDATELATKLLTDFEIEPVVKETVHAQTLLSFVKEQLEAGNDIPLDVFGIFQYNVVEVTLPKKSKAKKKP